MSRKKPEGYYPYDKDWGVGVSSMGENFFTFPKNQPLQRMDA